MIESREQKKAKTLLHKRKVAIVISLVLAVVLIVSSVLIYNFFNSVYYFTDVDEERTEYVIKKVNGVFAMYDKEGNMLPTEKALDASDIYYVTPFGTMLEIDPETGSYTVKSIPAVNFLEDGEYIDHELLTVFKGVDDDDISVIEINNQYGSYTLARYNIIDLKLDMSSDFVLMNSPVSVINQDKLSYITYYVGHPLVNSRLDDPIKDSNGEYSEYGLVEQQRVDYEGNTYDYKPSSYTITTSDGTKHTVVIGDRLIDGSGYYAQYINGDGQRRDAVYIYKPADMTDINGTKIENTILAAEKTLVDPYLTYPATSNDYFDVSNFTISQRVDGELQQTVGFSYVDLAEREGTVYANKPYVFMETSFLNYNPNYDNIDLALGELLDPTIVGVEVLSPSNEDKVAYGLMTKTTAEDGTVKYAYSSKYVVSFDKVITDEVTGEKQKINQTIYVSEKNEEGNYYTFTVLRFIDAPADATIKGVSLDTICEVAAETMDFVSWDSDDWVYLRFMEISINNSKKLEIISPTYSAEFNISNSKHGDLSVLEVDATYNDNGTTGSVKTFGLLTFQTVMLNANGQKQLYDCIVTPSRVYIYDLNGTEFKPSTRHFEYNEIGEQVHVIDGYLVTSDGSLVYVTANNITVKYANGSEYSAQRYQNTIFKKMFGSVTTSGIVDSYHMTDEDEQALLSDPSKKLLTVRITNVDDTVFSYSFYELTARKAYITVAVQNADDEQMSVETGGFYFQTTRVNKMVSDAKKFFAGIDVDYQAHK